MKAVTGASGESHAERLRQLGDKKDALQRDVEQLESSADRLTREGRREQPAAAGKMGEAADAIREQRVRDKIAFSKNTMRGSSAEYANAMEGQITENLGDVAARMRAAAGALGSGSRESGQNRSLEQARELVRGLESLRERVAGARLQIPLKRDRAAFVGELDDDVDDPRLAVGGVGHPSRVVRVQAPREVRCQAGVVAGRVDGALEDIDDGLEKCHADCARNASAAGNRTKL